MSKQQKAKDLQGYDPKPIPKTCANCCFYESDFVENGYGYLVERNIRCGWGQFAVKKTATCNKFSHLKINNDAKPN